MESGARAAVVVALVGTFGCSGRSLVGVDGSASGDGAGNHDDDFEGGSFESGDGNGDAGDDRGSVPETGFDESDESWNDDLVTEDSNADDGGVPCWSELHESRTCPFLGSDANIHVMGLESGSTCDLTMVQWNGFSRDAVPGGLAWIDHAFYTCSGVLVRIEQEDGFVETSDVACDWVTQQDGALLVSDHNAIGVLHEYADWPAVLANTSYVTHSIEGMNASRFAAVGSTLYGAWHSTDRVLRRELGTGTPAPDIVLTGFDDWVDGIDVEAGELLISSHGILRRFDLETGQPIADVVLEGSGPIPFDCGTQ